MTIEIEDAALARFLDGPAPHGSGEPTGFTTAREELALALEGQAPRLSRLVFDRLGPAHTAELAQVVRRAVAVGIRRRLDAELADRMHGLYAVLEDGLEMVEPDCVAPEYPTCVHCGGELHWDEGMGVWKVQNSMGWTDQCPPSSDRYHRPPDLVSHG